MNPSHRHAVQSNVQRWPQTKWSGAISICKLQPYCPVAKFVVLYWISIGTITDAATSKSKGHLSKTSMKPITIVYNLSTHILHDEHETYNNSIQPYNSYLAPQFRREGNKAERWMIPPQVSQLTTSFCHGIPNRNLLKLPGKWLFKLN